MSPRESLSLAEARRVALAAQGLLDARPERPTMRHLARVLDRTGVLQIDSVNVFARAHYLPAYSRLGAYDTDLLHRASGRAPRRLVEYWAHVAAYMPVELWPLMRWRMAHYEERGHEWEGMRHDGAYVDALLAEVAERGPSTARDLDDGLPRQRTHWGWNWSQTKRTLEYLFAAGRLAVSGRNGQFERLYDLPERVLPAAALSVPTPSKEEAVLELVRRAARSHGVATLRSIADYYRLKTAEARPAVETLVEEGELVPVLVGGRQHYLHAAARIPRTARARALLSPFDPMVWERDRARELFGFDYRIGIYTPAHQRTHGYYALPFLLGDRPVARVDLKADRRADGGAGRLLVQGVYVEPDAPPETGEELAAELDSAAAWLGLATVAHAAG